MTRLAYARIGGVEYGTPIPVAAEPPAPEGSALTLAVFPNPARDAATVRFSLDAPQRVTLAVFDVLGRRVLAADLGAQPSGRGDAPARRGKPAGGALRRPPHRRRWGAGDGADRAELTDPP